MKLIKYLLPLIIFIIFGLILTAQFFPSRRDISTSITIKASKEFIFNKINDLREWSKWANLQNFNVDAKDSLFIGKGALLINHSDGERKTLKIIESKKFNIIKYQLAFGNEDSEIEGEFEFVTIDSLKTKVVWTDTYFLGNDPLAKIIAPMLLDGKVKSNLHKALLNLKSICEGK